MPVTTGIQYYWLNTELVLLLLLKNHDLIFWIQEPRATFKGIGRPQRRRRRPVDKTLQQELVTPESLAQGNSCLPLHESFPKEWGPSTAQRECLKTPVLSLGFPGSFHRSACAAKLLSTRGSVAHVRGWTAWGQVVRLRDVRTTVLHVEPGRTQHR